MIIKRAVAVASCTLSQYCAGAEVTLESQPWPLSNTCDACVTVQFGALAMKLPPGSLEKVFISSTEPFALHLLPKGAIDSRDGALFLSASSAAYIGKYRAAGFSPQPPMSAEQFFDLLGRTAARDDPLARVRQFEHVAQATRYIKASKGKLHAYWIQASAPQAQYLHVVVDDSDTIYSLAGAISPQFFSLLLANMRVEAEP